MRNFECSLRIYTWHSAQKIKLSVKNFFGKCDQICRDLRIWSHLLRNSLMQNFIFCTGTFEMNLWTNSFCQEELFFNIKKLVFFWPLLNIFAETRPPTKEGTKDCEKQQTVIIFLDFLQLETADNSVKFFDCVK